MKTLADYAQGKDNNFNLIRLLAAIAVLWSHSYDLLQLNGREPFLAWLGVAPSEFAVNIFFAISGFLVAGSYCRSRNALAYVESRFLRIFPGLFLAVLFCALLVGGLFTTMPSIQYFTRSAVWEFVLVNSTLILDKIQLRYWLPGVFASNPYQYAVNGSLWTLPYEIWMYVGLLGLGLTGILKKRKHLNGLVLGTLVLYFALGYFLGNNAVFHKLDNFVRFGSYFFAGVVLYVNRDRVPVSGLAAILLVVVAVLTLRMPFGDITLLLATVYSVFWLAYVPSGGIRNYNKLGDWSYGTYIYAFPIQQSVIAWLAPVSPLVLFFLALPITLVVAALSWHLIEKRALEQKGNLGRRIEQRVPSA